MLAQRSCLLCGRTCLTRRCPRCKSLSTVALQEQPGLDPTLLRPDTLTDIFGGRRVG